MQIDTSVLAVSQTVRFPLPREEGEMGHDVARAPGENEADQEQH
jgi:hypothetical protein